MLSRSRRRLLLRRLAQVVPVLFLVTFMSFMLLHLTPGDPALLLAGEQPTERQIAEIRSYYGFDRPLLVQYGDWLGNALQGDLSRSFLSNVPVIDTIAERFPYTLLLVVYALFIATVVGAPLGIAAAARPGTWVDKLATALASLAIAVPYFWVGMVLVLVFAIHRQWFPAIGAIPFSEDPLGALHAMTLPAVALALSGVAEITRQTRAALGSVLASPYVRTLKAKGLSFSQILWKHGLKNISVTLLTVIGLVFNRKLGATVVIETVFVIPGVGSVVAVAAMNKDFALVQGIIVVVALIVVMVNLATDLLYTVFDPRVE